VCDRVRRRGNGPVRLYIAVIALSVYALTSVAWDARDGIDLQLLYSVSPILQVKNVTIAIETVSKTFLKCH